MLFKSELNVKKLTIIDDVSSLATLRAVPNAKVLGPRLGKEMKDVITAARNGQVREEDGFIIVIGENKEWKLTQDEIRIGYEGKKGIDVMSNNGVLVALDTELDDDLREEGLCNELNRLIQDMRKSLGYDISAKIKLSIEGNLDIKWKEQLAKNTLGVLTELTNEDADTKETVDIYDRLIIVKVKKIT